MKFSIATSLLFFAFTEASKVHYMIGESTFGVDNANITPAALQLWYKEDNEKECNEINKIVQEKMCLKPSNTDPEKYVFLWAITKSEDGGTRNMPFTSIISSEINGKNVVQLTLKEGAKFISGALRQYVLDIGDGSNLIKGILTPNGSKSIFKVLFAPGDPSPKSTFDRLQRWKIGKARKDVLVGGPFQQLLDPKFLQWSWFDIDAIGDLGPNSLNISGSIRDIRNYWIKVNGAENPLHGGILVPREKGSWEFHISTKNFDAKLIVKSIHKHVLSNERYLFRSVLSISLSFTKDSTVPDRKIFGITVVKIKKEIVVVKFKWLENQDGHSFTHIVKLKWNGDVYFRAAVYFNEGANTGGTVIVYPPKEVKRDDADLVMQTIHEIFNKDKYDLQISGPCDQSDVKMNKHYETPLRLVVKTPTLYNSYYLEFPFSSST